MAASWRGVVLPIPAAGADVLRPRQTVSQDITLGWTSVQPVLKPPCGPDLWAGSSRAKSSGSESHRTARKSCEAARTKKGEAREVPNSGPLPYTFSLHPSRLFWITLPLQTTLTPLLLLTPLLFFLKKKTKVFKLHPLGPERPKFQARTRGSYKALPELLNLSPASVFPSFKMGLMMAYISEGCSRG